MTISSRTPEGEPAVCPICNTAFTAEPSDPGGDAPCPCCGHLLWFDNVPVAVTRRTNEVFPRTWSIHPALGPALPYREQMPTAGRRLPQVHRGPCSALTEKALSAGRVALMCMMAYVLVFAPVSSGTIRNELFLNLYSFALVVTLACFLTISAIAIVVALADLIKMRLASVPIWNRARRGSAPQAGISNRAGVWDRELDG